MFICIWVLRDLTVCATCDPSNELKGLCNLGNDCLPPSQVHKISYIYSVHSKRVRSSERSSFLPSLNSFVPLYYNREATAVKAMKIRSALYETRNSPFEASNRRRSEEFRRHGSLWDAPVRASGRQNVSVMFLLEETVWEERRSYDGLCGERIWLGRWPGVCGRAEGAFDLSVCTSMCACVRGWWLTLKNAPWVVKDVLLWGVATIRLPDGDWGAWMDKGTTPTAIYTQYTHTHNFNVNTHTQ